MDNNLEKMIKDAVIKECISQSLGRTPAKIYEAGTTAESIIALKQEPNLKNFAIALVSLEKFLYTK